MSGNNDFQPFAIAAGAYVYTPSVWASNSARQSGFPTGILPKENLNTALRQANAMTSAIGAFIAAAGQNANDDGNIPELTAAFTAALGGGVGIVHTADFQGANQQLGLDGWQDFPGGLILQWVHGTINGPTSTTLNWPKTFPNLCFGGIVCAETNAMPNTPPTIRSKTVTQVVIDCNSGSDTPYCFVVGLGF